MTLFANKCDQCGELVVPAKTGRPRRFCSNACRQQNYRFASKLKADVVVPVIPAALRDRARWILHKDKRPISTGGWWTSVLDSTTWMSYDEVVDALDRRLNADGPGFVLNGDGVVCLDLDDCVEYGEPNVFAREFINALGPSYVEFSPSGRGLHIWGFSDVPKGRVFAGGNLKVEMYPDKRFITVTGRPYRDGALGVLNIANALRLVA